jgi:ketosteroid isomerase-like protein
MKKNRFKNASELLLEFTASSFCDPEKAAEMFAEDGAFEMPYLADFGFPSRYGGRAEIAGFFKMVRGLYPGFEFENVVIHIATLHQVFAEYEFTAESSVTKRKIHQHFFGRLVAKNGKITLLREALNAAALARAIYSQGIPELPGNGQAQGQPIKSSTSA